MAPITIYSAKAARYARYRWEYAPPAVEQMITSPKLDQTSIVVELGAGTGILTRRLVPRLNHVYAIEPDLEMGRWITEGLPPRSPVSVIAAVAESVPLPAQCADLVAVAQAIHWFDPPFARAEILRLLKPTGWLAIMRNIPTVPALNQAIQLLNTPEYGFVIHPQLSNIEPQESEYYYGHANSAHLRFPFTEKQDWEAFWGSLCSASFAPEEDSPFYKRYCDQAQKIFNQFSSGGILESTGETELIIGQPVSPVFDGSV